jgi:hypothetical protein
MNAQPWTYRPIKEVLKGLWRTDVPQTIYPFKAMQEPGMIKFFYYWLQQNDRVKQTKINFKLIDATEPLYIKLL